MDALPADCFQYGQKQGCLFRNSEGIGIELWMEGKFVIVHSVALPVINREDRREVRVVPTEKGKQLQEPITEIIDEVNEEVLKCFTEEEVTALKNALRIIADGSHFK